MFRYAHDDCTRNVAFLTGSSDEYSVFDLWSMQFVYANHSCNTGGNYFSCRKLFALNIPFRCTYNHYGMEKHSLRTA